MSALSWEVLTQQAIGVLVASPLPRTLRIAEVDVHIGSNGESLVVSQFSAPIPGQRRHQSVRKTFHLPNEGTHNILAFFPLDVNEHYESGLALCQGGNVRVLSTRKQISFPVAWDRTLLYFGRPFPDRYGVHNLPARLPLRGRCLAASHDALAAQTRYQFFL
jgi:hypothetical protein